MKLENLAQKVKITCRREARLPWEKQDKWQREAHGYTCTLSYRGRRLTVDFWMGRGIGHEPYSLDVLGNLLLDAGTHDNARGFEDWASELGLNPDSRQDEKLYRKVGKQVESLKKLLGDDYETFLSAEQD
jgi:hypothetical protein